MTGVWRAAYSAVERPGVDDGRKMGRGRKQRVVRPKVAAEEVSAKPAREASPNLGTCLGRHTRWRGLADTAIAQGEEVKALEAGLWGHKVACALSGTNHQRRITRAHS